MKEEMHMFPKIRLVDVVIFVISFVITKMFLERKARKRAMKRSRMY